MAHTKKLRLGKSTTSKRTKIQEETKSVRLKGGRVGKATESERKERREREIPTPIKEETKKEPIDDVIRLGGREKKTENILEKTKDIPVLGTTLRILASTKTTAILATTLGVLTGISAIQTAAAVGKSASAAALNIQTIRTGGSAFYKINSVTLAKSTSMIAKIARQLGKPRLVASVIAGLTVGAIGSYPFSLFIKEEAIQAIKGSYTGAMIQGDMEAAQLAMDERQEILNPELTEKILGLIPYVNTVKQLKDYFDTARTAAAIDQQLIDKQNQQIETGETDEEYFAEIERQRVETRERERIEDEEYFARVEENRKEAKREGREEDQKYWDKIDADRDARKKAEREADDAYWAAIEIENDKLSKAKSEQFSNLNFGLL